MDERRVPGEQRFVNAAIVATDGERLGFIGAFAPLYLWDGAKAIGLPFEATVWGIPGLETVPIRAQCVTMSRAAKAFVFSDGMLESRSPAKRINGDSLFFRFYREDGGASVHDPFVNLLGRYAEADSEGIDSHALLAVDWRDPA